MTDSRYEGHTPGPWRIWKEMEPDGHVSVLEVCETVERGRHPYFATIAKHWPEAEANARLIAAAPDLLSENNALRERVRVLLAILKDVLYNPGEQSRNRDMEWYLGPQLCDRIDAALQEKP